MDSVLRWSPLGNGEGKDTLILHKHMYLQFTLTNEYLSSYFIDMNFLFIWF